MRLFNFRQKTYLTVGSALLMTSLNSWADHGDTHQSVGGVEIYLGVIPVELVRGQQYMGHEDMHGGVPTSRTAYHLVAALFEEKSGLRLTEVNVAALVVSPEFPASKKDLEPMEISGVVTYGNYFSMSKHVPNRIALTIELPGRQALVAKFDVYAPR